MNHYYPPFIHHIQWMDLDGPTGPGVKSWRGTSSPNPPKLRRHAPPPVGSDRRKHTNMIHHVFFHAMTSSNLGASRKFKNIILSDMNVNHMDWLKGTWLVETMAKRPSNDTFLRAPARLGQVFALAPVQQSGPSSSAQWTMWKVKKRQWPASLGVPTGLRKWCLDKLVYQ